MAHKAIQIGDSWNRKAGTSNQTGNRAPRFPWSSSAVGRTARIVALCCAYRLGYDDDRMGRLHEFPPAKSIFRLFTQLLPWFEGYYNSHRETDAGLKGYTQPLEPFNSGDVENRVRYCFARPGRRGHDPRARLYGVSKEHPASYYQNKSGGRREVWARCSEKIMRRLELGQIISQLEAESWGR